MIRARVHRPPTIASIRAILAAFRRTLPGVNRSGLRRAMLDLMDLCTIGLETEEDVAGGGGRGV